MTMTPERWEQIKELFAAALERDPAARPAFLETACPDDATLRAEIAALLAEHEQAGSFMERPVMDFARHPIFSPGQHLAGRYRVVRFIGRGGMGEVYEVEDLELHERVALKTIRPEIAGHTLAIEHFKREVNLARKVTHPHVCRIFDRGRHTMKSEGHAPRGTTITFLTMEFLRGQTLRERVRHRGPMTAAEAQPLVVQMAAGLMAAHQAGIVHSDFKSGNVMLVPAAEGGAAVRAVITDFGLSHRAEAAHQQPRAWDRGAPRAGTPNYMAPEQVASEAVTAATDIYALGVVIYEMVTGTWPFTGATPEIALHRRLTEPPTSPRQYAPDLDARWEAAILRCLARDPKARFAQATDVVRALIGSTGADPMPDPVEMLHAQRRAKSHAGRWLVGISLALILLPLLILAYRVRHVRRFSALYVSALNHKVQLHPFTPGRSIAVLGFRDQDEDRQTTWLSTALSEKFNAELSARGTLRTIPAEDVTRMKNELSLAEADTYDQEALARIGKALGADMALLGTYSVKNKAAGRQVCFWLRLQDTRQGDTILAWSEDGPETQWPEMIAYTSAWLREQMSPPGKASLEASYARPLLANFRFKAINGRAVADRPEWQLHIDWAILNEDARDAVDCPVTYFTTYPECYFSRGRACLMERAIQAAKENDCAAAHQLAQIVQCHNVMARDLIRNAGEKAVCDYLKTY